MADRLPSANEQVKLLWGLELGGLAGHPMSAGLASAETSTPRRGKGSR